LQFYDGVNTVVLATAEIAKKTGKAPRSAEKLLKGTDKNLTKPSKL